MVRALIPKGYSKVDNIICLDEDCYTFEQDIFLITGLKKTEDAFCAVNHKQKA